MYIFEDFGFIVLKIVVKVDRDFNKIYKEKWKFNKKFIVLDFVFDIENC